MDNRINPADFYLSDWQALALAVSLTMGMGAYVVFRYRRRMRGNGPGMVCSLVLQSAIAGSVIGLLWPPMKLEDRVEIGFVFWGLMLLPPLAWLPSLLDLRAKTAVPWGITLALAVFSFGLSSISIHLGWFHPFRFLGLTG